MTTCYETYDPVDAQLVASVLRENDFEVRILDEAGFVLGYGAAAGPLRLMVPPGDQDAARQILDREETPVALPEDAEFPEAATGKPEAPWELAIGGRSLFWALVFVFGATAILLLLTLIGSLAGFALFENLW